MGGVDRTVHTALRLVIGMAWIPLWIKVDSLNDSINRMYSSILFRHDAYVHDPERGLAVTDRIVVGVLTELRRTTLGLSGSRTF